MPRKRKQVEPVDDFEPLGISYCGQFIPTEVVKRDYPYLWLMFAPVLEPNPQAEKHVDNRPGAPSTWNG